MRHLAFAMFLAAFALAGCRTAYRWTSDVPREVRTVAVPTFRNESDITELGAVMARQVSRELQREGTFSLAGADDAALEVQGIVRTANARFGGGDRRTGLRRSEYVLEVEAEISVVDRANGKVVIDNRLYRGETAFVSNMDLMTSRRDASARAADDIARQVVDDLLAQHW